MMRMHPLHSKFKLLVFYIEVILFFHLHARRCCPFTPALIAFTSREAITKRTVLVLGSSPNENLSDDLHYKFPVIHTIADVKQHIEGYKEFRVFERDFGSIINYTHMTRKTFQIMTNADAAADDDDDNDIHGGIIRHECRGIIFDKEGNIMSRPFHKFFNVNELKETKEAVIENSIREKAHVIMEIMDGSMIKGLCSSMAMYVLV